VLVMRKFRCFLAWIPTFLGSKKDWLSCR